VPDEFLERLATEELELTAVNVVSYEANLQNENGLEPGGVTFTAVPEPATLPILAKGLLAFGACRLCRRLPKGASATGDEIPK
jgi:hypothetical protein